MDAIEREKLITAEELHVAYHPLGFMHKSQHDPLWLHCTYLGNPQYKTLIGWSKHLRDELISHSEYQDSGEFAAARERYRKAREALNAKPEKETNV